MVDCVPLESQHQSWLGHHRHGAGSCLYHLCCCPSATAPQTHADAVLQPLQLPAAEHKASGHVLRQLPVHKVLHLQGCVCACMRVCTCVCAQVLYPEFMVLQGVENSPAHVRVAQITTQGPGLPQQGPRRAPHLVHLQVHDHGNLVERLLLLLLELRDLLRGADRRGCRRHVGATRPGHCQLEGGCSTKRPLL